MMAVEKSPIPTADDLAEFDCEARRLTQGLGQELTEIALSRITRFYQPLVETIRFSRVILEAITDGALACDPSGRIVLANSVAQRIFGLPPDIEGKSISSIPELACLKEPILAALASKQSTASHRISVERGSEHWELDVALHFARDARDGSVHWLLAIARDLTALKDMTFQLTQSSKLASLGTMLSSIIHDVNNPLANILGYSELITSELDEAPQPGLETFRNRLRIILDEALRARRIVENCLSFARLSRGGRRPIQMNQLIDETVGIFRSQLKQSGAKIETLCEPDLPVFYGIAGLMQQVLFNLVKNALDVLERTGVIKIVAYTKPHELFIDVIDNGPGIKPEHRQKLFNPFFTTKSEKEGTGLGLSIAKTIVEEHGGKLSFETTMGVGTTFRIALPVEQRTARRGDSPAPAPVAAPAETPHEQVQNRVLVLDDDPVMGKLIVDLVQRWYSVKAEVVFSIDSARAALSSAPYKIVFFNVRMQGVDALISLDRLKEVAEGAQIVTLAGSERPEFVETLLRRGATVHLRKPFSLNTLLKVLGRVLPPGV